MTPASPPPAPAPWQQRWQNFSAAVRRGYHAYGRWLVRISWWRFAVYALALLVVVAMIHDMPPFTWRISQSVELIPPVVVITPTPPAPPPEPTPPDDSEAEALPPPEPAPKDFPIRIEEPKKGEQPGGLDIVIGKDDIRITSSAASAAGPAASKADDGIRITLPPGATADTVRKALQQAKREVERATRQAREAAAQAARQPRERVRVTRVGIGDAMMQMALLWILGSAILKFTYKERIQAERQAAAATETAEAESLKRQVAEARMAAMQAQVEPHFLFNTLASIDHLIETDPARASQMQKNLIALLRASMPTMREAAGNGAGNGVRDLGRELAVIRPYLEILKVRMEERLTTTLEVPDGLLSAEFPPMMIQTLVENAIKHGLEPQPEGGQLLVRAEIVHGKLQVTVADTGLGFGQADTAGTGVGLANIRERLQLLYGTKASLSVAENQPRGTRVTVTLPYKTVEEAVTA
ncbi:MAG: histidine kinase [Burkholderiales bacterium]|nr:histidine kinase [Burkholderiales bacterium]